MISGLVVGHGIAWGEAAAGVTYQIIKPDHTAPNLATMAQEGLRWRGTVDRYREMVRRHELDPQVVKRAQFVEEVLAAAADRIRVGACCVLVAQTSPGRILGVVYYAYLSDKEAALNLQGVDPEHLPSAPGGGQLRGIGTALIAAASRDMLTRGVETVYLHPFDQQAAIFWSGRGFQVCGAGGRMCVRGRSAVEALLGTCDTMPDCPSEGECVICGLPEHTVHVRDPRLRG